MQADRRRYIRFDVPLEIIFKPADDAAPYIAGLTRNFSRDGCCIESENRDMTLQSLELKVKHPISDIYITTRGNIVWQRQVEGKWLAGISIVEMDTEAKSEILDFAYDLWLNKNIRPS
ncbi:MAG: PilZ domain-containing protein [Nitrospirae bacterium]|nr:PilZ domain-containing protein [Nitrospirota bacterium]